MVANGNKKTAPAEPAKTEGTSGKKKVKDEASAESKAVKVSPFSHAGGEASKQMAIQVFNEKKASTPPDWKENVVKDDRHVGYLPPDWTPGLKMTDGGILIKVYVGPPPARHHVFHKADLEKHLGRELAADERENPKQFGNLDPKKFIKRKDRGAAAGYINDRCNRVHGMSVEEALGTLVLEHRGGVEKQYSLADLKYDLKYNRIELVDSRPSQSSNPNPAPTTPARAAPATPAAALGRLPATPNFGAAPGTPAAGRAAPGTPGAGKRVPGTPKATGAPATPSARLPGTPGARLPTKRPAPVTPASNGAASSAAPSTPPPAKRPRASSASAGKTSGSPAARMFQSCYATLKTKAATSEADDIQIFTMMGLGLSLGLESPMLKMLPELLKKAPADRGVTMQFILDQFEQALVKT